MRSSDESARRWAKGAAALTWTIGIAALVLAGAMLSGCAAQNHTRIEVPLPGGQMAVYDHSSADYKDDRNVSAAFVIDPKTGLVSGTITGQSSADVNAAAHAATVDGQLQTLKGLSDLLGKAMDKIK